MCRNNRIIDSRNALPTFFLRSERIESIDGRLKPAGKFFSSVTVEWQEEVDGESRERLRLNISTGSGDVWGNVLLNQVERNPFSCRGHVVSVIRVVIVPLFFMELGSFIPCTLSFISKCEFMLTFRVMSPCRIIINCIMHFEILSIYIYRKDS